MMTYVYVKRNALKRLRTAGITEDLAKELLGKSFKAEVEEPMHDTDLCITLVAPKGTHTKLFRDATWYVDKESVALLAITDRSIYEDCSKKVRRAIK